MVANISNSNLVGEFTKQYVSFTSAVPYGDVILLGIGLIIIFMIIGSVAKGFNWLLKFLSGLVLLCIFAASFYFFIGDFSNKLVSGNNIIFVIGLFGVLLGMLALMIIVYAFSKSHKVTKPIPLPVPIKEEYHEAPKKEVLWGEHSAVGTVTSAIKNEKSVLAVISYVMITEFGIFSSKTTSAPDAQTGILFFMLFLVGVFFLIKFTYSSFGKGFGYLIVALVFGFALSIFLGYFWVQTPLETLLSINYFASDSLVAFVSGVAISLLMCSRE